jgi:hypothetical protein
MSVSRFSALALVILLAAGGASAATYTVSKNLNPDANPGQFQTIQAAVNATTAAGDVVLILDTEIYAEQVTIDGREDHPWKMPKHATNNIVGGKNGITIRYVPQAGNSLARPTIRYQDKINVSPKDRREGATEGDTLGSSNNFATNGALRIIRASGITIEGINIDGGGSYPFANPGVWREKETDNSGKYPLCHGNSAVAVVVSSNVQIRDCKLTNAFFGIAVKDRNTGGIFANRNPGDNDVTIPLSKFGGTGYHLFEYNRLANNDVGVYFESSWDRGSTIRYNLIYGSYHRVAKPTDTEAADWASAGIKFKDNYLSPVAIYNNTFFENEANIAGGWQIGAQHLLYNNIFGRRKISATSTNQFADPQNNAVMDGKFPNRMFNCLFSATQEIQIQSQAFDQDKCAPHVRATYISDVSFRNNMPKPESDSSMFVHNYSCNYGTPGNPQPDQPGVWRQNTTGPKPGGLMTADRNNQNAAAFPRAANIRWLETAGLTISGQQGASMILQNLFESTDSGSANFLVPKWSDTLVQKYIKGQGWADGTRNEAGEIPDIGAVQSSGKKPYTGAAPESRIRIQPAGPVMLSGGTATADIMVTTEVGSLSNVKVKSIRWIAPIPDNEGKDPGNVIIVGTGAIQNLTAGQSLNAGSNIGVKFTVTASTPLPKYGFFEIVVEGTSNGKTVTSDVGFLPYRELKYTLKVEFFDPTGTMTTARTWIDAGEPYRMRVRAFTIEDNGREVEYTDILHELSFRLMYEDGMLAYIRNSVGGTVRDTAANVRSGVVYPVYIEKAGGAIVSTSGTHTVNKDNYYVFLGTSQIEVRAGPPFQLKFLNPGPERLISPPALTVPDGMLPLITRGVRETVEVQVQDRFENPVGAGHDVKIEVDRTNVGNVDKTTSKTEADGVARFIAEVTNGARYDAVRMTASATMSIPGGRNTDVAGFQVGRVMDRLEIFYGDAGTGKEIDTNTGNWVRVTVKALSGGEVMPGKQQYVCVTPSDSRLMLAAAADGTGGATGSTTFPMANGVAVFYVGAEQSVEGGLDVSYQKTAGCDDGDFSLLDGSEAGIVFTKPETSLLWAVVFGDGTGRPDSVIVKFARVGDLPDRVELKWPSVAVDGVQTISVTGDKINVRDSVTLMVDFRGATTGGQSGARFLMGYTSISGNGRGLVTLYNGAASDDFFIDGVLDGVGPVIAAGEGGRGSPYLIENLNPGVSADTLIVQISEAIGGGDQLLGNAIFYSPTGGDPAVEVGTPLEVAIASADAGGGYRLIVTGATRPDSGGWIRFNPSGEVLDRADNPVTGGANGPHLLNRWVQVGKKEVSPMIDSAWYTSNSGTGYRNFVFVAFNKPVALDA